MSFKGNVENHLTHFANSIGLDELKLNEHHACGLCFDETMVVNIEYLEEDEALIFVGSVIKDTEIQHTGKKEFYEMLLAINLYHKNLQGAFMALSMDKSEVLLLHSLNASLDYHEFEMKLEKFVNSLEWVKKEVSMGGEETKNFFQGQSEPTANDNRGNSNFGMMV